MLEEYQAQAQQIEDQVQQVREMLETLVGTLQENYPEEERTFRMGQAMAAIDEVNRLVTEAQARLQNIEWPTTDRPR